MEERLIQIRVISAEASQNIILRDLRKEETFSGIGYFGENL
jgi:hypothetical protein